jgi:PPOX class probable F420-dependent enzyme
MWGRDVLVPVDTIKPKRTTELQRVRNLGADPRCTLLVEHYSDDWAELWWVRVSGSATQCPSDDFDEASALLADRHPQYGAPGSITTVMVLTPTALIGWRAR